MLFAKDLWSQLSQGTWNVIQSINFENKELEEGLNSYSAGNKEMVLLFMHMVDCSMALRDIMKQNHVVNSNISNISSKLSTFISLYVEHSLADLARLLMFCSTSIASFPSDYKMDSKMRSDLGAVFALEKKIISSFPDLLGAPVLSSKNTMLHVLAKKSDSLDLIKHLINRFESYSAQSKSIAKSAFAVGDIDGMLPLHHAIRHGDLDLPKIQYIAESYPKALISVDEHGFSPLHHLFLEKDVSNSTQQSNLCSIVSLFITKLPKCVRLFSKNGRRLPIHLACSYFSRQQHHFDHILQAIHLLLDAFPQAASIPCSAGLLPLHRLLHGEAQIAIQSYSSSRTTFIQLLRRLLTLDPMSCLSPDREGLLPIHHAIGSYGNPNEEVLGLLIEQSPSSLVQADLNGFLPLHLYLDQAKPSWSIVRFLLNHNLQTALIPISSSRSSLGELLYPLHFCLACHNPINVQLVLALAALDPSILATSVQWDAKSDSNWSPLQRAHQSQIASLADGMATLWKDYQNPRQPKMTLFRQRCMEAWDPSWMDLYPLLQSQSISSSSSSVISSYGQPSTSLSLPSTVNAAKESSREVSNVRNIIVDDSSWTSDNDRKSTANFNSNNDNIARSSSPSNATSRIKTPASWKSLLATSTSSTQSHGNSKEVRNDNRGESNSNNSGSTSSVTSRVRTTVRDRPSILPEVLEDVVAEDFNRDGKKISSGRHDSKPSNDHQSSTTMDASDVCSIEVGNKISIPVASRPVQSFFSWTSSTAWGSGERYYKKSSRIHMETSSYSSEEEIDGRGSDDMV